MKLLSYSLLDVSFISVQITMRKLHFSVAHDTLPFRGLMLSLLYVCVCVFFCFPSFAASLFWFDRWQGISLHFLISHTKQRRSNFHVSQRKVGRTENGNIQLKLQHKTYIHTFIHTQSKYIRRV